MQVATEHKVYGEARSYGSEAEMIADIQGASIANMPGFSSTMMGFAADGAIVATSETTLNSGVAQADSESAPLTNGAPVTRDDAATGKLLQSILDIVAECDQTPEFAGFQVSEARNADGLLLYVRLVPCDNVGGIVSPRTV